ncbi:MAG: SdrD B-like domain-containing protein, partial [Verrucomicrobiota bacterium]
MPIPTDISGRVLRDEDEDGAVDTFDTNGLAGVMVVLTDTNGVPIVTNLTDAAGNYGFSNIPPGSYRVIEIDPPGFFSTGDSDGGDSNRIDVSISCGIASTDNIFLDAEPIDVGDWAQKMKITFCGYDTAGSLTNFPVLVLLDTSISNFSYGDFASASGFDLIFTGSGQTQALNYDVELWDTTGVSRVWVQVPLITDTGSCIFAYWGNPGSAFEKDYTTNGSTWSEGYVAVWHMNQTSPRDASGNANHGFGQNVTTVPGILGDAVDFDGAGDDDIIDVVQRNKLPIYNNGINDEFTIEGWINGPGGQANQRFFSEANSLNNTMFFNLLSSGGADALGRIFIRDDGGANILTPNTTLATFDDTWRHFSFSRLNTGGANRDFRHWIDGQEDTATVFTHVDATLTANNTTLGAMRRVAIGQEIDAALDEVRISCVPRASNWVWATYQTIASNSMFSCYEVCPPNVNVDISGQVRDDQDADGDLADVGDPGIPGVTVVLTDTNGIPVATNITDALGNYIFTNVPPGDYIVVETDLPGYTSTGDLVPPDDNMIPVTAVAGSDSTGNDFLDTRLGQISGSVFVDVDGDGTIDLEDTNGIAGVTVVLSTNGVP